ncbi:uncharacterized protein LOC106660049 [Trichogramma pretiosum]|uniref:Uncharacterized protein n=1 Tax=Trichogramma kaykai TaxID=54128 RepID=A0ABD2WZF3_9HYME|nr:uncharacterized protein LOC106660049 [Trichogramma pretiosum]
MGPSPARGPEVDENLSKSVESFQGAIRGRGIANFTVPSKNCLCERRYKNIICLNCGHLMFGRVRYQCPKHKMITFLIDITNCPKCKCFEFMLNEFEVGNEEK